MNIPHIRLTVCIYNPRDNSYIKHPIIKIKIHFSYIPKSKINKCLLTVGCTDKHSPLSVVIYPVWTKQDTASTNLEFKFVLNQRFHIGFHLPIHIATDFAKQ